MGVEDENDMDDTNGYEKSGVQLARLGLEDLILEFLPARLQLLPVVLGMTN
jgi:hypothetical protein